MASADRERRPAIDALAGRLIAAGFDVGTGDSRLRSCGRSSCG